MTHSRPDRRASSHRAGSAGRSTPAPDGTGTENGNARNGGAARNGNGRAPRDVVPPPPAPDTPTVVATAPRPGWRGSMRGLGTFDSLHLPAYRWFFASMLGQMASVNMQMVVRGYLVYLLTGSYAALGTVALMNAIPGITLALYGGVLADRVRQKKHVVQIGQFASASVAFSVALLLLAGRLRYEHLLIAAFAQGAVQALMMPSRQAMIPEVVGMKRLMNAVALNSAGQNTMRVIAPGIGGFLLAVFTPKWVYFLMTASYLSAVAFLAKVPDAPVVEPDAEGALGATRRPQRARGMRDMLAGVRYIAHDPTLRVVLSVNMLLILTSMPYTFLLPGFVSSVLHAGPSVLGLLLSATGAGSLVGALVVASLPARRRGLMFLLTSLLQGVMLVVFTTSPWIWFTTAVMVVMGVGQAGRQSFSNVLVQHYVEDQYRGRVMSVYMMQFSLTSLGTFFVGVLASMIGAPLALGGAAVVMVLVVLYCLAFVPSMRTLQ